MIKTKCHAISVSRNDCIQVVVIWLILLGMSKKKLFLIAFQIRWTRRKYGKLVGCVSLINIINTSALLSERYFLIFTFDIYNMCIYITRLYIILVLPFCNSESKYAFYLFSKFLRGLKRKNVQNLGIIHGKYWYTVYTKITFGLHAFANERKRKTS